MSLLSQVKRGKIKLPHLVLLYGVDGIGKSTFGANAPAPIFIGPEKGTANLDVARYPKEPKSFDDVMAALGDLLNNGHEFQTLVIDSLDWIEPLVQLQVCSDHKVKNIEDIGYGKGYTYALDKWRQMIGVLAELRQERQMNIILIAHCHIKPFNDPALTQPYDRYQLKLNDKAAALWREFVDSVMFANLEIVVNKEKGASKAKAFSDDVRYLFTERTAHYDAKNRFGLPEKLELNWNAYVKAVDESRVDSPETLKRNIETLLSQVTDETIRTRASKAFTEAGDDSSKLAQIKGRLETIVSAAA